MSTVSFYCIVFSMSLYSVMYKPDTLLIIIMSSLYKILDYGGLVWSKLSVLNTIQIVIASKRIPFKNVFRKYSFSQ